MSQIISLLVWLLLVGIVAKSTLQRIHESLLHPIILFNGIITYYVIVPAAYILATGNGYFARITTTDTVFAVLSVVTISYAAAIYGFQRASSPRLSQKITPSVLLSERDAPSHRLRLLGLLGFTVGLLSYTYYIIVNGGPVQMFTVQPRTAFTTVPETGRWRVLGLTGIIGGYVTILTSHHQKATHGRLTIYNVLLLATVCTLTVASTVLTRARMMILLPLLILVIYLYNTNTITDRQMVGTAIGVGSLVLVGGVAESLLVGNGNIMVLLDSFVHRVRLEIMAGIITQVPSQHPYGYGETLLRAPMINWPGMPLRYGDQAEIIMIGENRKYTTMSGMLVGELWLNWGILGVIGGSLGYGGLLGLVYQFRNSSNYLVSGSYPIVLVTAVLLWPTNIAWATKSLVLRLIAPLVVATIGVIVWTNLESTDNSYWYRGD